MAARQSARGPERSGSDMSFENIDLEEARGAPREYRKGKPVYESEIGDPDSSQAQLERLRDLLDPKNLAARLGVNVAKLRERIRRMRRGGRRTKKMRKRTRRLKQRKRRRTRRPKHRRTRRH